MPRREEDGLSADTRTRIAANIKKLASRNEAEAIAAESRLIRTYGARAVPQLIEATHSPSAQVRMRAAWALGQLGDTRAFEDMARLTRDRSSIVRYDTWIALGHLGDLRAIPMLVERALRPSASHEEGAAAMGLAKMHDLPASALVDLARSDDPEANALAAYLLDNSTTVDSTAFDILLRLMESPESETQERVMSAFSRWRDEQSLAFARAFLGHSSPVVRAGAVEWLTEADEGEGRQMEAIRKAADDPAATVRLTALRCLQEGYPGAVEGDWLAARLAPMLADEGPHVAIGAVMGLFRLPARVHGPIITAALQQPDDKRARRLVAVIRDLLRPGTNSYWTTRALASLGRTGDPRFLLAVRRCLREGSPSVRRAAIAAEARLMAAEVRAKAE